MPPSPRPWPLEPYKEKRCHLSLEKVVSHKPQTKQVVSQNFKQSFIAIEYFRTFILLSFEKKALHS